MSSDRRIASGQLLTAFIISLASSIYSGATKLVLRGLCCPGRPALADLDDRLLADIGVLRSEVMAAAHGLLPLGGDLRDGSRTPDRVHAVRQLCCGDGRSAATIPSLAIEAAVRRKWPPRLGTHETGEHQ